MTMTTAELKKYKEMLHLRESDLMAALAERSAIAVEAAPEEMDNSVLAMERDLASERLETGHRLLREIRGALRRIERGTYGICVRCDRPISLKRLDAIPWAAFCVRCQESVDRLHENVRALERRVA